MDKDSKILFGDVVIILSKGRSGSDFVSRVTENLGGAKSRALSDGVLGMEKADMVANKDPLSMMQNYLIDERKEVPYSIIGFKWKPIYWNDDFDHTLEWAAQHDFQFIYNYRNPLDVHISEMKHSLSNKEGGEGLRAHCKLKTGDQEECAEESRSFTIKLDLDSTMKKLAEYEESHLATMSRLEKYNVTHLVVRYEDLTYGSEESRLAQIQRICDFLPEQYHRTVSMADFATDTAITSNYNQSLTVENFAEVKARLMNTEYAKYLHG